MSFTDDFETDALADIYAAVGEDVLVYPVPAPQVAGYGGTPATVRGMFVFRDEQMTDGQVIIDVTAPVFECSQTDAAAIRADTHAVVFRELVYSVTRRIERDARVAEMRLRLWSG